MDPVTTAMLVSYSIFAPLAVYGLFTTFYDDSSYSSNKYSAARLVTEPASVMVYFALAVPFGAILVSAALFAYRIIDRERQRKLRRLHRLQTSEKLDGMDRYIEQVRRRRIEELEYETGVGPRPYRGGIARKA